MCVCVCVCVCVCLCACARVKLQVCTRVYSQETDISSQVVAIAKWTPLFCSICLPLIMEFVSKMIFISTVCQCCVQTKHSCVLCSWAAPGPATLPDHAPSSVV